MTTKYAIIEENEDKQILPSMHRRQIILICTENQICTMKYGITVIPGNKVNVIFYRFIHFSQDTKIGSGFHPIIDRRIQHSSNRKRKQFCVNATSQWKKVIWWRRANAKPSTGHKRGAANTVWPHALTSSCSPPRGS